MENYGLTPTAWAGPTNTSPARPATPSVGLSYTTFTYGDIRADRDSITADGQVTVRFDVTNTGKVAGSTVAQVYAAIEGADLPAKRLAGFQKTALLQPGERQTVAVTVPARDLAFYDEVQRKQVVRNGTYRLLVGPDAATVAGSTDVRISGHITPRVAYVSVQPDRTQLTPGDTLNLTGQNPWIADDSAARTGVTRTPSTR